MQSLRRQAAGTLAGLFALPLLSLAQETDDPLLYLYSGGIDELLVDARDAGLKRALLMVDDRLLELPGEIGAEVPPPILRLIFDVIYSPMDLELHLAPPGQTELPVDAQLRVFGNAEKRESIAQGIEAVLTMVGTASEYIEGSSYQSIPMPMGSLLHGSVPTEAGREGYSLVFGEPRVAPPRTDAHDLPAGVQPALYLDADATALRPYLEMVVDMAGPQGDLIYEFLDRFGLFGEEHLGYRVAVGHGADRMHTEVRVVNGVTMLESLGTLVREPLTLAELRLVPSDAVVASMWKVDLSFLIDMIDLFSEAVQEDIVAEVEENLGLNLENDVLSLLGNVGGFYTADSTGGGGLFSSVLFQAVKDEGRMNATLDKIAGKIDAISAAEANGYVAMRSWQYGNQRCRSLQFPGLPVPIEPSMALRNGVLWIAATPQALRGAIDHASSAQNGLIDSERFQTYAHGSLDDLNSFSYQDTPRQIRDGYGMATLAFTALRNAVRSPHTDRDPGMVQPGFDEMVKQSRPTIMLGRIEGDDLVVRGEGDRSFSAQMIGLLGNPMLLLNVLSGFVGAAASQGPELERELENLFR